MECETARGASACTLDAASAAGLTPGLDNCPDELVDEERNATSDLVADGGERRRHVRSKPQPDELGYRLLAQRRKYQDLSRCFCCERRKQRRTVGRRVRSRRRDDRNRQFLQSSPQEVKKAQRRLIRPVHIVNAQQQRAPPPQVCAQPVEPVQDSERRVEQRAGVIPAGHSDTEQRRRMPGRATEQLGPFPRRHGEQRGLEQLTDHAVAEISLKL